MYNRKVRFVSSALKFLCILETTIVFNNGEGVCRNRNVYNRKVRFVSSALKFLCILENVL